MSIADDREHKIQIYHHIRGHRCTGCNRVNERKYVEMLRWIAIPIMVVQGLTARSRPYAPLRRTLSSYYHWAERTTDVRVIHRYRQPRRYRASSSANTGIRNDGEQDIWLAKNAFDVLARKSKSWKRLGSIVDLALDERFLDDCHKTLLRNSICDVGTDHGLLATGLAMTRRFDQVLGVDVSEQALRDGALKLQKDIEEYRNKTSTDKNIRNEVKVQFRRSDGLQNVQIGEADIVCIAGMGVHTMVDILTARRRMLDDSPTESPLLVDMLETRRLILQPTNSRPRLLQHLYNHLHQIGWRARAENIDFVSSRYYFTVEFGRSNSSVPLQRRQVPGTLAMTSRMSPATVDWVAHHKDWILLDSSKTKSINENDQLWLNEFDMIE